LEITEEMFNLLFTMVEVLDLMSAEYNEKYILMLTVIALVHNEMNDFNRVIFAWIDGEEPEYHGEFRTAIDDAVLMWKEIFR
jgi:hypothetical protein